MNTMNEPKFRNKDGSLTRYAFACGYIQSTDIGQFKLDLYKDGCYHVRVNSYDDEGYFDKRIVWDCFDNLTDARKRLAECLRNARKVLTNE